jgi:hypothetical protein
MVIDLQASAFNKQTWKSILILFVSSIYFPVNNMAFDPFYRDDYANPTVADAHLCSLRFQAEKRGARGTCRH